ncbi:DUF397 domain-containing protein [Nocardia goodfellowii]|uniref:DUF397 domain-containing protein n=1 Tax=Nocardia goodfellowii TaxID=882446 RepID=A0ABS4QI57_9NOCA|nr:DUF397 domain-containing protein [Nocardia goodfellowii]MBP2191376.1 hypothetical protein [Nocardia goodfellowii]
MMQKKDLAGIAMFKAAASGPNGDCVAFGMLSDGSVAVFNTRDEDAAPVLVFTPAEWEAFLEGARTNRFIPV